MLLNPFLFKIEIPFFSLCIKDIEGINYLLISPLMSGIIKVKSMILEEIK